MSDLMLHGVLNMPVECWSENEINKNNRHSVYKQASERIKKLESLVSDMNEYLNTNNMTSIGSGAIFHVRCKELMEENDEKTF
jgi:polysaccharide deacetylase 2 family uncharacterized protein YibQ